MLREFRDFAMRGNVIDLAVAVVIGVCIHRDRHLTGERYHHAARRCNPGRGRFFNPVCHRRKRGHRLRQIYPGDRKLLDHRIRIVPGRAQHQQDAEARSEAAPAGPPADVVLLTEIRDLLKAEIRSVDNSIIESCPSIMKSEGGPFRVGQPSPTLGLY